MDEKEFAAEELAEPSALESEETEEEAVCTESPCVSEIDDVEPLAENVPEDCFDISEKDIPVEEPMIEPVGSDPAPSKRNDGIVIRKSHLIIGAAVTLALMIGGFFLGYFLKPESEVPAPEQEIVYLPADPMKPDPNAKPYGDVQAFPENPTPGNIIMPGYSELRMHADTNVLKAIWINSEGNECYLRFTLKLSDTGETLYQSGLIAPGMAVEESLLSRSLSRGEYRVEILIEAFTLSDDPIPLNGMKVTEVMLYVL